MVKIIARETPGIKSYDEISEFISQIHVFTVNRKKEKNLTIIIFSKT